MKLGTNKTSNDLFQLLQQWKTLTLAEGECILAEDWSRLADLQSQKAAAQGAIEISHNALLQSVSRSHRTALEEELKNFAQELLQLASENRQLLGDKLAKTKSELNQLDKTSRSIRHVQRAYGTAERSFWQAYS